MARNLGRLHRLDRLAGSTLLLVCAAVVETESDIHDGTEGLVWEICCQWSLPDALRLLGLQPTRSSADDVEFNGERTPEQEEILNARDEIDRERLAQTLKAGIEEMIGGPIGGAIGAVAS